MQVTYLLCALVVFIGAAQANLVGGWSECKVPSDDALKVFLQVRDAMLADTDSPHKNVQPECVKIQVVNGINYKFLVSSEGKKAFVRIHKPIGGEGKFLGLDEL